MKNVTKIILILTVFINTILIFASCTPYNAVIYGDVYTNRTYIKDEFYEANLTDGSWSEKYQDYVRGEVYPESITLKITDKEEMDKIFKEFPQEVDFEKSMILMYCCTTASSGELKIKDINFEDDILTVKLEIKKQFAIIANASMPMSKWVIIVMDKVDAKQVVFAE